MILSVWLFVCDSLSAFHFLGSVWASKKGPFLGNQKSPEINSVVGLEYSREGDLKVLLSTKNAFLTPESIVCSG